MKKYESMEFQLDDITRILDRVQELYYNPKDNDDNAVDNQIPHETSLCDACQIGKCMYIKKQQNNSSGLIKAFAKMVTINFLTIKYSTYDSRRQIYDSLFKIYINLIL